MCGPSYDEPGPTNNADRPAPRRCSDYTSISLALVFKFNSHRGDIVTVFAKTHNKKGINCGERLAAYRIAQGKQVPPCDPNLSW